MLLGRQGWWCCLAVARIVLVQCSGFSKDMWWRIKASDDLKATVPAVTVKCSLLSHYLCGCIGVTCWKCHCKEIKFKKCSSCLNNAWPLEAEKRQSVSHLNFKSNTNCINLHESWKWILALKLARKFPNINVGCRDKMSSVTALPCILQSWCWKRVCIMFQNKVETSLLIRTLMCKVLQKLSDWSGQLCQKST